MANIFEFLSKDGNITPEKARKSRQKHRYRWDPSLSMSPVRRFAHFMPSWQALILDFLTRWSSTWWVWWLPVESCDKNVDEKEFFILTERKILRDQVNSGVLASPAMKTPNLDQLAKRSAVFQRVISLSTSKSINDNVIIANNDSKCPFVRLFVQQALCAMHFIVCIACIVCTA